jgi:hypothetical protein
MCVGIQTICEEITVKEMLGAGDRIDRSLGFGEKQPQPLLKEQAGYFSLLFLS